MNSSYKKAIAFSLFCASIFSVLILNQEISHIAHAASSNTFTATTTEALCSEYNSNGVSISMHPKIIGASAGSSIDFVGYIQNDNKFPVVEGKLYAKIIRPKIKDDGNGPDILDTFVIKDNITLKVGQKIPVDFTWAIPAYSIGGDFKLTTYFISGNRFSLGGNLSTNTPGDIVNLNVKSQQNTGVFFNKIGIKINNKKYLTTQLQSDFESATGTVTISVPVTNTTKARQAVNAEINIFKYDSQSPENKISTKKHILIIEAGKTINIPVVVNDTSASIYYVESVLKYKDSKSILGVNFVRGVDLMPRFNFISSNTFPLGSGQKSKIIACFRNTSSIDTQSDVKLNLEILDVNSLNPVMSYQYNGKIKNTSQSVSQEFSPKSGYRNFKIHATLYSGEKLTDEVYIPYDCNIIDPSICSMFDKGPVSTKMWLNVVFVIFCILILFLLVTKFKNIQMFLLKIKKNRSNRNMMFLLVLLILFSTNTKVYADACNPNITNISPNYGYKTGLTTAGSPITVTITGSDFDNIESVLMGYKMVNNFTINSSKTSITFNVPPESPGWRDVGVKGSCWGHKITSVVNAFYYEEEKGVHLEPPIVRHLDWAYNDVQISTGINYQLFTTQYLGHTYFSQQDNFLDNKQFYQMVDRETWPSLLGKYSTFSAIGEIPKNSNWSSLVVRYPSVIYDDYGRVLDDSITIPSISIGDKIHFNFDKASSSDNLSFSNYPSSPNSASWVTDANSTNNVCSDKNYILTRDRMDAVSYDKNNEIHERSPQDYSVWQWDPVGLSRPPVLQLGHYLDIIYSPSGDWPYHLRRVMSSYSSNGINFTNSYGYNTDLVDIYPDYVANVPSELVHVGSAPINSTSVKVYCPSGYSLVSYYNGEDSAGRCIKPITVLSEAWDYDRDRGFPDGPFPPYSECKIGGLYQYKDTSLNSRRMNILSHDELTYRISTWCSVPPIYNPREADIILPNVDEFVQTSVTPPEHKLSFIDTVFFDSNRYSNPSALLSTTTLNQYSQPPLKNLDAANWLCDSNQTTCSPTAAGTKSIFIYYSPIYGRQYYGEQTDTERSNGICRTNGVPLFAMTTKEVNKAVDPYSTYVVKNAPVCIPNNTNCPYMYFSKSAIDKNVVGCPNSAPYYSSLDNKCYDSDNYRYLSIDPRAATSSYVHYFYPEDILFKNATYRLKVNITPVDADHTPAAPTITGSSTVNIGDVNIYEMFSPAKKVAKNDTNSSMLGSIIFGIKKLFAQSGPEETVHYMIDWGGGASPGQTDNFAYGSHASSTHIWTEATTTQIRVAAVDTLTDSKSPWTTFPITVVDPAADYTYGTPSLSTSKICSGNLTLSWNKTYRSDGALSNFYSLNKNDSIINDVISGSVTSISLGTDFANGDRYQLYAYGPTSFADPDTSKSSAPSNILTISATVPIRDSSSCTVVVPPVNTDLDVVILDGMTFSANPSWAKISGKCNFSGKIDATIKTAKNDIPLDTYTNITVNSCSVDGKTVPIGAAPFKVTAEIPFSISSLQFGIGKHKLSCEITASSSNTNSIVLAYPSVEAKCSKVPTVIEK